MSFKMDCGAGAGMVLKPDEPNAKDAILTDGPKRFRLFDYQKNRQWSEGLAFVIQIGLTMVGCIVFCFFVGLYLDRWLGTRGVFLTIFTLLGVVGGAFTVYRQIGESIEKDEKRQRAAESEDDDKRSL